MDVLPVALKGMTLTASVFLNSLDTDTAKGQRRTDPG